MGARDRRRDDTRAALVAGSLPALAMLALGLWGLRRGSLYSGECATFWAGHLSWPALFRLLTHIDAVHGLYYALMHVVFWFGHTEVTLRLPSVLGAVGAVLLTAVLTVRLTGSRLVAFAAAGLVASAPSMSQYAQSGRSYALVCMLTLVASLGLVGALRAQTPGARPGSVALRWLGYGVALTFCGYLHELSFVLLLVAHAATLAWVRPGWRVFGSWLASAAVALWLVLPLMVVSVREDRALAWMARPGWRSVGYLVHVYLGSSPIVVGTLGVLVLLGTLPGWRHSRGRHQQSTASRPVPRLTLQSLAVPLLLLPPAALLGESAVAKPLYDSRYVLFCLPAAMMLAAAGLERVLRTVLAARVHPVAWATVVLLLVGTLAVQWSDQAWLRTPDSRTWNLNQAAGYLRRHVRPGDGVDFLPRSYSYLKLTYPAALERAPDFRLARGPRVSGTFHGVPKRHAALKEAMLDHRRVWLVGDPSMVTGPAGRRQLRLLHRHYQRVSTYPFHGGTVVLFRRVVGPLPGGTRFNRSGARPGGARPSTR